MPVSDAVIRVLGNIWASDASALIQTPENATPAVNRAIGYTAIYSATQNPEQETIQGRWNEFDSAIDDTFRMGVPFYDARIPFPAGAITNEGGNLYRALRANGPGQANAAIAPSADTGGLTWERVRGRVNAPSAPARPTVTSPRSQSLYAEGRCPLDGGAVIEEFVWEVKLDSQTWEQATVHRTAIPVLQLNGLTNDLTYDFRYAVRNSAGLGEVSPEAVGIPRPTAPGAVSTIVAVAN